MVNVLRAILDSKIGVLILQVSMKIRMALGLKPRLWPF